eukprot:CAMPEP_0180676870 /NCGR_PEP_ID=MMETSP1037_2-20121125/67551_1 /TAXON_ID=632150 /ORGANISM="Azadinium spinosum, Strain 3D9" /LENGTH=36 /DNA_ID= /DNA_START= /DNA_END= /DNA_ORIENTATION=
MASSRPFGCGVEARHPRAPATARARAARAEVVRTGG